MAKYEKVDVSVPGDPGPVYIPGKRIQAKDLRGVRDESLVDAVPLDTPWTMFIEPTNACNFRCVFCPTGHPKLIKQAGRKNTLMEFELFKKVIDDLRVFPRPLKMLNLYKDGESLLHPDFPGLVRYAKGAGVSEQIWVKTNGSHLNPKLNKQLVTCGLDMLGISAFTEKGFKEIAGVGTDYQEYRANVLDLYQKSLTIKQCAPDYTVAPRTQISVKIADTNLTNEEKQTFMDDFSDRCDYIAIEGLHGWSASAEYDWKMGTNQSFDGTPRTEKIACPLVMYMLTVNSNGSVSICNDDWMQAHNIGDANTESIKDIWNGNKLRHFRMMHLKGLRGWNAACNGCDYMQVLPDNIDEHLDEMKGRL